MRTIKFRGKRVDNGEWVYGYFVSVRDIEGSDHACIHNTFGGFQYVIPDTAGQFTGLIDKNGKEIYEGDVLQRIPNEQYSDATGIPLDMLREDIGDGGDLVFVRYDESQSSVMYLSLSRKFNVHWLNTQYFTIIGNIHDNPELMKQND
jgi:uncharacterized phage protein (TIGR01671 family)